jgi:NADH-quinone oxidoreductase subunit F
MHKLAHIRQQAEAEWNALTADKPLVLVGNATCGRSAGSLEVLKALRSDVAANNIDCNILEVGCIGLCYVEPVVCIIKPGRPGVCYGKVTAAKAVKLLQDYLVNDEPASADCLGTFGAGRIENIPELFNTPVFKPQVRRALQRCGFIDPTDIGHYLANGGYQGLEKGIVLGPEGIIEEIKNAGLRGRGGAGFPTWRKWQFCRDAESDMKYLICNADEGDPGAFMNRALIEGDPHALIEGMILAAYALGAQVAYIYCRAEYPLALERLRLALSQAEAFGLLGENILGSGFKLSIKIKEGAGAFVCGEETALIKSIEGDRGMPTPRPPFPAVSGLWGKPTIINNVETLAYVGLILQHSAAWFSEYGTDKSKGTKTIALVGKVKNTGLVEVPLGISMRELVFDIGGGIADGRKFKAVQTGGPSGGCLPESLLDIPVDYDALNEAGTIMGSGGVVVMDEDTCMVDFARYFLDFAEKESCGKCTPCRLGTRQLLTILEDITAGRGRPQDIETLEELSAGIKTGSLCGLGQTAPNPVLSTLRYFREEYEAHIHDACCPAKKCKAFITYHIADSCVGCGFCLDNCASGAIFGEKRSLHWIDQELCCKCGICYQVCPPKVFSIEIRTGKMPDDVTHIEETVV